MTVEEENINKAAKEHRNFSEQIGHEWLIEVEENRNQYKPCELIGIFVSEIKSVDILNT